MNHRICVSAVIEKDGAILLGRKPRDVGPYPNTWQIPGGGVELGEETIMQALKREIKEETNIEITDIEPLFFQEDKEPNKHGEMTRYIFLIFKARYLSGTLKAQSDMRELKWIKKSEIKNMLLARPSVRLFRNLGYIETREENNQS